MARYTNRGATRKALGTMSIEAACGGDPIKLEALYYSNPGQHARALDYLGITPTELRCYAILWDDGVTEIPAVANR